MIEIKKKQNCCGCGACVQACPKSCIFLVTDEEGFAYPVAEQVSCLNCGACDQACPMGKQGSTGDSAVDAFAAYAKDEKIREESSSGGVFSLLAQSILSNHGVVFGAAFAEDFSVHHIGIERSEDLPRLRGSKYLQSRIENTYREAKTALESGRPVLFSGVGCQIAGLKSFLKKEYANLYTVDVLCHGVPSPEIWQKYLQEHKELFGAEITGVSFRNKNTGWKQYSLELTFQNDKKYSSRNSVNTFMKCFLSNICLRPSCYACRFKEFPRLSDITIGDAWGIDAHMPDMDDDRGTSVIVVNSQKGGELLDRIREQMRLRQGNLNILLPQSADSRKSVKIHPRSAQFFAAAGKGASMAELERLTRRTLLQKALSRIRSCANKILKK